ncbi:hypothetical protein LINPERHAP1_LOCUS100 [Linum perenne]
MHRRPLKRSQTDKAKSVERPGSSAPPRHSQIPRRGRTNPPPSVTPIKIEELKESSSSPSSPSSSSASYTESLSPPLHLLQWMIDYHHHHHRLHRRV